MIAQSINDAIPDGAVKVVNTGDTSKVYFADDPEVIAESLTRAKIDKQIEVLNKYTEQESSLLVNKNDYNDLQALTLAGLAYKDKTIEETKQAFTDAVIARTEIQTTRDDLIVQVNTAATTEEIEVITW